MIERVNTMTQGNLGRKGLIVLQITVYHQWMPQQELRAETCRQDLK